MITVEDVSLRGLAEAQDLIGVAIAEQAQVLRDAEQQVSMTRSPVDQAKVVAERNRRLTLLEIQTRVVRDGQNGADTSWVEAAIKATQPVAEIPVLEESMVQVSDAQAKYVELQEAQARRTRAAIEQIQDAEVEAEYNSPSAQAKREWDAVQAGLAQTNRIQTEKVQAFEARVAADLPLAERQHLARQLKDAQAELAREREAFSKYDNALIKALEVKLAAMTAAVEAKIAATPKETKMDTNTDMAQVAKDWVPQPREGLPLWGIALGLGVVGYLLTRKPPKGVSGLGRSKARTKAQLAERARRSADRLDSRIDKAAGEDSWWAKWGTTEAQTLEGVKKLRPKAVEHRGMPLWRLRSSTGDTWWKVRRPEETSPPEWHTPGWRKWSAKIPSIEEHET